MWREGNGGKKGGRMEGCGVKERTQVRKKEGWKDAERGDEGKDERNN